MNPAEAIVALADAIKGLDGFWTGFWCCFFAVLLIGFVGERIAPTPPPHDPRYDPERLDEVFGKKGGEMTRYRVEFREKKQIKKSKGNKGGEPRND